MHCRSADPCPRLPVRSAPATGESIQGYLLRLAEANGYRLPWLLRQAAIPPTYATTPFDAGVAPRVLGAGAGAIAAAAAWPVPNRRGLVDMGGHHLPAALLLPGRKRICPACLSGDGIARQFWQLLPAVACVEHESLLMDECPACHRLLDFRDVPLAGCRCGWRSGNDPPRQASSPVLRVTAFLHRAARAEEPRQGEAPIVGLGAAMRLTWLVAGAGEEDGWRASHMSKPSVAGTAALVGAAAPVLLQWPDGLHQWLADRRRDVEGRVGLRAEFGAWSARLSNVLRFPGCEAVAQEARCWLARDWGRRTLKPSSFLASRDPQSSPLTLRETADRLGVAPATITRMIADGRLVADSRAMGSRTMRRIRPEEVDRVAVATAAMLDARSASEIVGVSEAMIERLGRAGVLRAEAVSVGGRRTMRYGRPTLEALAGRLARVAAEGGSPADPVRLVDLPARRQVSTLTVLGRVLGGELRCFHVPAPGDGRLLAAFAVSSEEALLSPGRGVGGVSVREAAKAIGVNVRMVPILVAHGCLSAVPERSGRPGIDKRGVVSASVRSFPRLFVMTSEIARSRGTSTRAAISALLAAGTRPVVMADSARGISAVWRREDAQVE